MSDAMQVRNISNLGTGLHNPLTVNKPLRDTVEAFELQTEAGVFITSFIQLDHVWTNVLNRDHAQGLKNAQELQERLDFTLKFIPLWDTTLTPKERGNTRYKVEVTTKPYGSLTGTISGTELQNLMAQHFGQNSFGDIKTQARPAVNNALFVSLRHVLNVVYPTDNAYVIFSNISRDKNILNLQFKITGEAADNIESGEMQVWSLEQDGDTLVEKEKLYAYALKGKEIKNGQVSWDGQVNNPDLRVKSFDLALAPVKVQIHLKRFGEKKAIFSSVNLDYSLPQSNVNSITFARAAKTSYGLDIKGKTSFGSQYETVTLNNQSYTVGWKSLEAGGNDDLTAMVHLLEKQKPADSLYFEFSQGTPVIYKPSGDSIQNIKLSATTQSDKELLQAYTVRTDSAGDAYQTETGRLNVVVYKKQTMNLVLVPVNGNGANIGAAAVQSALDNIYLPAVTNWLVSKADNFIYTNADNLDEGGNAMLSKYTKGMNDLIKTFGKKNVDNNSYYLFLVGSSQSPGLLGQMPLTGQFGFVFTPSHSNVEAIKQTIAHELGHGPFHLKHPFSEFAVTEGSTDNLMDYGEGTELNKYQWDLIHDPQTMLFAWAQDESEGASHEY
ncbi:MAG: hypothetical protein HC896_01725 [Bacteroidales bacterium]|nr:hypothetical protein [Bacteroidales bacterium]